MFNEYDFQVAPSSPAYGAGGPLTTVTANSTGNSVRVEDARWFSDGFGATSGDVITIGSQNVRITNINFENNTLIVNQKIRVSVGVSGLLWQQ